MARSNPPYPSSTSSYASTESAAPTCVTHELGRMVLGTRSVKAFCSLHRHVDGAPVPASTKREGLRVTTRMVWPALLAALVSLSPRMDTSEAVPFDPPIRTVVWRRAPLVPGGLPLLFVVIDTLLVTASEYKDLHRQ